MDNTIWERPCTNVFPLKCGEFPSYRRRVILLRLAVNKKIFFTTIPS